MRLLLAFLFGFSSIYSMELKASHFLPPCTNVTTFTCTEVMPNGDVQLSWIPPADPDNSFVRYEIYSSSNQNGPFGLLTVEIVKATSTYLHVGAGGDVNEVYYYIRTISSCGGSDVISASDTLASIHLLLVNPNNGTADLKWNDPVASGTGNYVVKKEYPPGVWTTVSNVQIGQINYIDIIDVCGDNINYRIEYTHPSAGGCVSVSNIDGDFLTDITDPEIPEINVSVDTSFGGVEVSWLRNPAEDTKGYVVFKMIGGFLIDIDTVYGINSLNYIDSSANPGLNSECYTVAAFDSCKRPVSLAYGTSPMSKIHCTMYLQNTYNACGDYADLTWNNYIDWPEGVQSYEIYGGLSKSSMNLLSINGGSEISFTHNGLPKNTNYFYVIKAISANGKTSLSNVSQVYTKYPQLPSFVYLSTATVTGGQDVELHIHGDPSGKVNSYRIERSTTPGSGFVNVGVSPNGVSPVTHNDYPVQTGSSSYYYRVIAIDSCGNDALISNESRTIFLSGSSNNATLKNTLSWNDYEGWDGNMLEYRIYRGTNGIIDPTPIATVPFGQNTYVDDVESLVSTKADGEFCYLIEGVEDDNTYGFSEVALSNVLCLTQQPLFYVPNAYVVNGVSGDFKPVASFFDFHSYELQIYNRFGQQIFVSNDIDQGWNGQFDNVKVPHGVYVYKIRYEDGDGNPVEVKGIVTLLK